MAAPAVRAQAPGPGVALIIGNSKYKYESPLPNARRDSTDIAKRFRELGLKTELLQDADRNTMRQAVEKFAEASRGTHLSVFSFAGHGTTARRSDTGGWGSDLVPIDADLSTPASAGVLTSIASVHDAMSGAAHRLAIFDNCRNDPVHEWRPGQPDVGSTLRSGGTQQGSVRMPNRMWMLSAAPGRVAFDGPAGQNSPFAAALLRNLAGESTDLRTLGDKARRDVLIATEGRQIVQSSHTYDQPFVLKGPRDASAGRLAMPVDSSRIAELPNAYAFARENKFPLHPAMVAFRPPDGSPHRQKVGAFKFTERTDQGFVPAMFIVLSVGDDNVAELQVAGARSGGGVSQNLRGTASGNRIEYKVPFANGNRHSVFEWRGADSGTVSGFYSNGQAIPVTSFSRLDG